MIATLELLDVSALRAAAPQVYPDEPERVEMPGHLLPRRSSAALLEDAAAVLDQARGSGSAGERYALAHLAALRTAAAVLARRARPVRVRGRAGRAVGRSAWQVLGVVAPELREWADFFASGAARRHAAEAGLPGAVSIRQADDLVREAERFLATVQRLLGPALGAER
jgi:hypothetical protein